MGNSGSAANSENEEEEASKVWNFHRIFNF